MEKCPNCGQKAERTEDWACQWCGYPLLSKFYKKIPKTHRELKEEKLDKQKAHEPQPEPTPETEPVPQPEPVKGETATVTENTSGQGKLAVFPREIEGWNWGAFLLNWLWSISNNVWIGLLVFIPYVNVIMIIILGVKGNEWAWRSKRWDSIEHFKETQKKWSDWGIALLVTGILVGVGIYLLWVEASWLR